MRGRWFWWTAQSVPHQAVDVIALDCDFLAFSGHKMLGPTGIGVLYGKRAILEKMPPFLGGGGMIQHVRVDAFEPACLGDESDPRPARFEAGTPPIAEAIGLRAAVDYLSRLGMETVSAHERELTVYAHELLSAIPGLRILGPEPEAKTGIVSFTLRDAQGRPVHGHDVAEGLDKRGIAVRASHHCAEPLHRRYGVDATVRASFYLYNTRDEVDRLAEAIEWIRDGAAHRLSAEVRSHGAGHTRGRSLAGQSKGTAGVAAGDLSIPSRDFAATVVAAPPRNGYGDGCERGQNS